MTSCLLKLKVTPSFCLAFKIPDDVTASNIYICILIVLGYHRDTYILIVLGDHRDLPQPWTP